MSSEENGPLEEAGLYFHKGLELARLGRYEEALAAYRKALRIDPNDPETYLNLGFVYYEMGFDAEAQLAFERARNLQTHCAR